MKHLPLILLFFALVACAPKDPPDCNGGAQDYINLCTADEGAENANANGQSMYESCAAFQLADDTQRENDSYDWVDCMSSATSCDDASACSASLN